MKVTEELIDQILDQGENGALDPSPYMESLKYLILEDEDVELTEEDHAYLIFLGTICLESLKRNGLYKDIDDEELIFDMEDTNWEALENTDGNLDEFMSAIRHQRHLLQGRFALFASHQSQETLTSFGCNDSAR